MHLCELYDCVMVTVTIKGLSFQGASFYRSRVTFGGSAGLSYYWVLGWSKASEGKTIHVIMISRTRLEKWK